MHGRFIGGVLLAMGTAVCTGAHAAGFIINGKSVSGLGASFAGEAALAEDASTVYNNPANMLQLNGTQVTASVSRIGTGVTFTNNGSNTTGTGRNAAEVVAYVPNFYYVDEVQPDLRFGFGINAPFGLGLNYDKNWMGRYFTIETNIRTVNLSPSVAYRVSPSFSVGGSLDAQYMDAAMSQAVDFGSMCLVAQAQGVFPAGTCTVYGLSAQHGDGTNTLKGTSWAPGYSIGASWTISSATQIGAVFHSGVSHKVKGTSTFEGVPTPFATKYTNSDASVKVNLPAIASVGVAQAVSDKVKLLAEYTWTGWSSYKELRVDFSNTLTDSVSEEKWRDTYRISLGAHYQYNPTWLFRGGYFYDQTPVPDATHRTPRLPDADRRWLTMGAKWAPSPDFSVDMALAYVNAKKIPINRTDLLGHNLKGTYEVTGTYASLQTNWAF